MSEPGRRPLATQAEVAEYCGVSVANVKGWRYRNAGPKWIKVGKNVRYRWADVEAWLERHAVGTGRGAA